MQQLYNRRILLGISGGIAAYKSAELVRTLKKAGADVRVVMTRSAMEFITPLTLQALSGHPVHHSLLDPEAEAGMGHIELAKWADLFLIAPASANLIARLSQGMGDDLLTTVFLATDAPICLAPAMNQAMWRDPITQENIAHLKAAHGDHLTLIGPAAGEQACGDTGLGRMSEPDTIVADVANCFETGLLAGVSVVVTAGPTKEAIDPVRYITNHSSGKMGYAIAEAARDAGARVTLISGPVALQAPERMECVRVRSALDMLAACEKTQDHCQIFIATAAVADYRPASQQEHKIKKHSDELSLTLIRNPDILSTMAAAEQPPFTVGFAAETQDVEHYARDKLTRKKLNMIVANDVSDRSIGFHSDDNAVKVFWGEDGRRDFELMNKRRLAVRLIELIAEKYQEEH
ncbi:MAG TPA: bifunctional phosphopantothenoylcysteine decarboxylase/phosphopantothenate--cysteine ligase CoaBC [Oceanospirillales bacterium]|nr:bifunctional phosphopantothenoylcysteine decarboxylase/phosphopantothenate--cysteine ligase CoaBC [Oceanospirillaceae bacterium]HBS41343.1 bifunctional phosphopantothenoylcysteine decarboxylase/phosphopantothenate--cysteine ligase CoaBC [Oceanospirillales bacterium]|tara:strand:- start:18806 stop:20020 length:1215 start_codon:yes stop_codon:yes gene_type:complete